ncbi:hypothetical protein ACOMHN_040331 [Nucella lapillus]
MFFSAIEAVYGPSRPSTSPLLSVSGTRLKEKSAINERWREHFSTLLNRPSTVSAEALDQIPQRLTMDSLDAPPTMEEVTKVIHQTSSGKATGMDGIPAEFFKAAGPVALEAFHGVLCSLWDTEDMPQEFRDATIVSLYKNKGSKSDCGNYCGISLLFIAGKIMARIILNRLIPTVSENNLFGLTISLGKTEVMFQPTPTSARGPPSISIEGTKLKTVEEFKYLGSVISSDGSLDKEVNARICKASQALGRLRSRVLNQHNTQQSTKLKVYNAVVLTSLLYGCETWSLYRRHVKLLERFHMRSLRSILGIKWQDRITSLEVLDRAETASSEAMIMKAQLRWTGHFIRMDDSRIPKQLLYGELCLGKRSRGRPQKRFKDCVKASIAHTGLAPKQLEERAQDRTGWRTLTYRAQNLFEKSRRDISEARERRKATAAAVPDKSGQFPCPQFH